MSCVVFALLMISGCSQNKPDDKTAFNRMGFAEFTYEGKTAHIDKVKLRLKKTDPDAFLNIAGTRKCYCSISNELANYGNREDYIFVYFQVPFDSITKIEDLGNNEYSKKASIQAAFGKASLTSADKSCKVKFLKIDTDNMRAYGMFSFTAYQYEEGIYGEDREDYCAEEMPVPKEVVISDGIFFAEIEDLEFSGLDPKAKKK
ncbi:MAG: hypothetical protein WC316_05900 [Candidatus Omnitrophota bacterium]